MFSIFHSCLFRSRDDITEVHLLLFMRRGVVSNFFMWGEVVGSFFNCYCVVNFFMWRKMVLVNFLGYGCLCSNLCMVKDTSHHPEPEEGVVASLEWVHTHHSFLRGEEDTSQHLKDGGEHVAAS